METSIMDDSTIFEGVSDGVLCLVTMLFGAVLLLLYNRFNHVDHAPTIHPTQESLVDSVRRMLGLQEQGVPNDDPAATIAHDVITPTAPPYNHEFDCPICYGPTNCILSYWRHVSSVFTPVSCPVCRANVAVLLNSFSEHNNDQPDHQRALEQINDYNRRFSGQRRPLMDHIHDLPVLLPYLLRQLFSFSGLVWMFRLRILLCLVGLCIYVLSPLDIIPESVFGFFGLLDDVFIAFVLMLYVTIALGQLLANQND